MAQDQAGSGKGASRAQGRRRDWATDRLTQHIVAQGFDEVWARETAERMKLLQRTRGRIGRNAISDLCVNTSTALPLLRTPRRGTVRKYVEQGHLDPFVLITDANLDWPTVLGFLRADVELLRLQQLAKPRFNLGPSPWEPPSQEELEAWLGRHSPEEIEALLAPDPDDESS